MMSIEKSRFTPVPVRYDTVIKNKKPESNTSIALQDIIVAKAIDDSIKKKRVIEIKK